MKTITVDVMPGGEIRCIDKPETASLSDLGRESRRRISRVEPVESCRRFLFIFLRSVPLDPFAKWTRSWKCEWRVRMLRSGFLFGRFENRQDAIAAEVRYWELVESLEE
jgi:hypothetical protein